MKQNEKLIFAGLFISCLIFQ